MIIEDIRPFNGQHCETTATGTLLKHIGIDLSEPMLFGIGQGLGFIYWHMKNMDFPFLGGRIKQDTLTKNIVNHLGLTVEYKETSSKAAAWRNVKKSIDNRIPVALKLDCFHLDYFSEKFHFAGHYVTMYGYDEKYAYLVDAAQPGMTAKTSLESLAAARSEKGPMASENLSYAIAGDKGSFNLKDIIPKAIRCNAYDFLNPPIRNIGYKGIKKTGEEIKKWSGISKDIEKDFTQTSSLMEEGGTGGALFRKIYRDFLREASDLLADGKIGKAYERYCDIAAQWTEVARLIEKAGRSKDMNHLNIASGILESLATQEKSAMEMLLDV